MKVEKLKKCNVSNAGIALQYIKCGVKGSLHGRQGDAKLISDVLEKVIHS